MNIVGILIMVTGENPIVLASLFQGVNRPMQDFIRLFCKILMMRPTPKLEYQDQVYHMKWLKNGLGAVMITDETYSPESASNLLGDLLEKFHAMHHTIWPKCVEDTPLDFPHLNWAITHHPEISPKQEKCCLQ